jgi:hypothetical protein
MSFKPINLRRGEAGWWAFKVARGEVRGMLIR